MRFSPLHWLVENFRIYFGNASAIRDYRSQLRGNKAILIWLAYLGIMILLTGIAYMQIVTQQQQSISNLQNQLRTFYMTIMGMLGAIIVLATPAMTASTITLERQRQSLDLVFSAPVKPKYLLVGKMISSFRYTWMLLVLALPVTSVCVVMGGATWTDVIYSYIQLSSAALIFTSIGILMSTIAPTTVAAIIWTYISVGMYIFLVTGLGAGLGSSGSSAFLTGSAEAPWAITLSPFLVALSSGTYTNVSGTEVPNWIFGFVFALFVSKLMLLGAASSLGGYRSPDTLSLRIHGLIYAFVCAFLISDSLLTVLGSGRDASFFVGAMPAYGVIILSLLIPVLSCFSFDALKKFQPDGVFSIAAAFRGTPGGGLPYLWLLVGCLFGGTYLSARMFHSSISVSPAFYTLLLFSLGYVTLWWSLSRLFSSGRGGLKAARILVIGAMILVLAIPLPIMSIYEVANHYNESKIDIYRLHILFPAFDRTGEASTAHLYAGVFLTLALVLVIIGQSNLARLQSRYVGVRPCTK